MRPQKKIDNDKLKFFKNKWKKTSSSFSMEKRNGFVKYQPKSLKNHGINGKYDQFLMVFEVSESEILLW